MRQADFSLILRNMAASSVQSVELQFALDCDDNAFVLFTDVRV